jgi:hypothetical protein
MEGSNGMLVESYIFHCGKSLLILIQKLNKQNISFLLIHASYYVLNLLEKPMKRIRMINEQK